MRMGLFSRFSRSDDSPPGQSQEEIQASKIAELTRSRRAIADAFEIERQRIERDLHDGTQQYLVAAAITLGEAALTATGQTKEQILSAQSKIQAGLAALRETVRGISPQVLHDRGLIAALEDVMATSPLTVEVRCPHPLPELSPSVLAAAYFFTMEALTNAVKHAPDADVTVLVITDENLRISVLDTGPGGARLVEGGGLAGMRDRLAAFGGTLFLSSPAGGPTLVRASIPLLVERGQSGLGASA